MHSVIPYKALEIKTLYKKICSNPFFSPFFSSRWKKKRAVGKRKKAARVTF
jgi:hypothetical protein